MTHIVFWLFIFTLGGGLVHAWLNLRRTKELHAEHTTTSYSIPEVYQTCTDNRRAAVGVRNPSGPKSRPENTAAGVKHDRTEDDPRAA